MTTNSSLEELIQKHRVLICVGSGGVGKTTVSAAIAVRAAQLGKKVLVMTIDPAKRLKIALGLTQENQTFSKVPDQHYSGELYAAVLNAQKIFLDFIMLSANDKQSAERLVQNRLYKQLSTTLSGSQEFTSLLQLSRLVQDESFDLIVLDTPPAQHAIDFLEAPDRIGALFKDSIVRWFLNEEKSRQNFISKMITRGTQTALAGLEYITGSVFMSELNDFFKSVGSVQNKISSVTESAKKILSDEKTGFILVTGFNKVKLEEANELKRYLDERNYNLLAVILNRSLPSVSVEEFRRTGPIQKDVDRFIELNKKRELDFNQFVESYREKLLIVRTTDFNDDMTKLNGLERFANEMEQSFLRAIRNGLRSNG